MDSFLRMANFYLVSCNKIVFSFRHFRSPVFKRRSSVKAAPPLRPISKRTQSRAKIHLEHISQRDGRTPFSHAFSIWSRPSWSLHARALYLLAGKKQGDNKFSTNSDVQMRVINLDSSSMYQPERWKSYGKHSTVFSHFKTNTNFIDIYRFVNIFVF